MAESSNIGERSFEDCRVAIEQGTATSFTVDDMKRVLQCIDALDGELADSTREEMGARASTRCLQARIDHVIAWCNSAISGPLPGHAGSTAREFAPAAHHVRRMLRTGQ